jgi:hypothetical protein
MACVCVWWGGCVVALLFLRHTGWALDFTKVDLAAGFPLPFAKPFATSNTSHMPTPAECAQLPWSLFQGTFFSAGAWKMRQLRA